MDNTTVRRENKPQSQKLLRQFSPAFQRNDPRNEIRQGARDAWQLGYEQAMDDHDTARGQMRPNPYDGSWNV